MQVIVVSSSVDVNIIIVPQCAAANAHMYAMIHQSISTRERGSLVIVDASSLEKTELCGAPSPNFEKRNTSSLSTGPLIFSVLDHAY